MNILEKQIEDLVYDCISEKKTDLIYERGLWQINNYHVFGKQLDLGPYGRLDMIGLNYSPYKQDKGCYKKIDVGVFEFKKDEVNISTYLQAVRYCKGLEVYIMKHYNMVCNFSIILVGTSICKSDFCFLPEVVDNLTIYTTKIDLELGVKFKVERGYSKNVDFDMPGAKRLESLFKNHIYDQLNHKVNIRSSVEPF